MTKPISVYFTSNSGCLSSAFEIAFAESTPKVLPSSFSVFRFLHFSIASTISFAAKEKKIFHFGSCLHQSKVIMMSSSDNECDFDKEK